MEEKRKNDEIIIVELRGLKELMNERFEHTEANICEMRQENKEQHEGFGKRINILELWQANTVGKITVISIAIGIGISIFTAWVTNFFK